jgi:radical SAM protein with 4Fe4S-binding SPASM domain
MCPLKQMKRKTGMMEFEQFKQIADQIKGFGTENTRLNLYFFGETFLHSSALGMIAYAKNAGIRIEISTNVLSLNEEEICNLMALLDQDDCLVLSLDGYDKEKYESIRKGGNFEKMFQNFHWIIREHHRTQKKPMVIAQAINNWGKVEESGILNTENCSVEEFISLFLTEIWTSVERDFEEKDIDNFIHQYKTEHQNGEFMKMAGDKICFYIKGVDDWAAQMGKRKREKKLGNHQSFCDFPWRNLIVQWNGDVTICCKDVEGRINIGNVFQTDLKEMWNGKKIRKLREEFLGSLRNTELCRYC